MAPLDTGSTTASMLRLVDTAGRKVGPTPTDYDTLGAYLKAVREHRGETLSELADSTRVRGAYLAALEQGDRSILPSRPFAIGYVRSYATALGLDGDLAVERFKRDWPEASEPLRNPVGVGHEGRAQRPLLYALAAVLIVGVGLWNVAQRTLARDSAPASIPALADAPPVAPTGPMAITAPNEAPAESTIPTAYVTPGMDAATAPASAAQPLVSAPVKPGAGTDASAVFVARGPVHGVGPGVATVVLQARKPMSLIVHGADATVYFARQIAAGEAFRAPLGRGLVADVSDPANLDVYVGGRLAAGVPTEPLFLDKIPAPPVPASASVVAASAAVTGAAARPQPPQAAPAAIR